MSSSSSASAAVACSASASASATTTTENISTRDPTSQDWDNMWPFDQIMALSDDEVLDTMVSSWYSKARYEEIVESWSMGQLRQICTKMKLKALKGDGCCAKMR